jgi:hypothetical protein
MAIALVHDIPGGTQDDYDRIVQELVGGELNSLSDWPADGILVHIAGPTAEGWRVVDVWESEAAIEAFGERLGPAMEAAGVDAPAPITYPAYKFIKS